MEINSVSHISQMNTQTDPLEQPASADVEAFSNLFGKSHQSPDEIALSGIQEKSLTVGEAMDNARNSVEAINDPDYMRITASKMSKNILEVDLIAKTAGSLAQGINKLTSMQ